MTRCPHCPRPPGSFCLGTRSPIVCRRRDPDDVMRDETFDRPLAGEDGQVPAEASPSGPDPAAHYPLYGRMHGCRFRRPIEGQCPDCRGLCTRGDDPAVVERDECFQCPVVSDEQPGTHHQA